MQIRKLLYIFIFSSIFSCTEDNDITVPRNLQEYIATSSNNGLGEVIACAASVNASLTYIFYYPEKGATDIRYYETDSLDVDEKDFSKYRRKNLTITNVFGGKLQRFSRSDSDENWCLVTYVLNGELHKSNPIRLKNATSETTYTDKVTIDYSAGTLKPKFTWTDQVTIDDNATYFQVISEKEEDEFVSGVFTKNTFFQYFETSNIETNINVPETPNDLVEDTEYLFTMMAVSEDNWVNTVIEEAFIPRNLEEYLALNSTKTQKVATAFAASSNGSESLTYIYYHALVGASDMRYYETNDASIVAPDFSQYRRKNLTDNAVYDGKLRRYSRTDTEDSWCIITYVIGDVLYKSEPIKIQNQSSQTQWLTESDLKITYSQTSIPQFNWQDYVNTEDKMYLQVIEDVGNNFLSGTFTEDYRFKYLDNSNVIDSIHTETPPALIFDDKYNFTLMRISNDNWVNLVIKESFTVE